MRKIIIQNNSGGFTLVETLVAISILLLVIVGPMTIAQKGIRNAYFANEQVTAVFLAQEASEAVRVYRDNQALAVYDEYAKEIIPRTIDSANWVPSGCTSGCAYNNILHILGSCATNNSCLLKKDSNGTYRHDIGVDSPFKRIVTIGASVNGGVPVTVDVSWNSNSLGLRHVILQTWIYDHYQRYEN